ncbi:MAG: hypothetical protein M3N41_15265 [Acidobacteriota bacterium]|nr:hypothetical protein [Acidobacteriota bacterium]
MTRRIGKLAGRIAGTYGFVEISPEVARREVWQHKLLMLLDRKQSAWNSKDHPELKDGAAAWVSKMRHSEQRFRELNRICTAAKE